MIWVEKELKTHPVPALLQDAEGALLALARSVWAHS